MVALPLAVPVALPGVVVALPLLLRRVSFESVGPGRKTVEQAEEEYSHCSGTEEPLCTAP